MTGAAVRSVVGLDEGLAALRVALPHGAGAALEAYLALLGKWNRTYNLTAIREPERMVTHHLLDALAVLPTLDALVEGLVAPRMLDVGSGAGIPGIPLAIARPRWSVVLLDPNHKKTAFLTQAVIELGLSNVRVEASRVEDHRLGPYDIVISRAFADLASFARTASRLVAPGGRLVAMKGVHPHEEIDELDASIAVRATPRIAVPGLHAERHLVVMEPLPA